MSRAKFGVKRRKLRPPPRKSKHLRKDAEIRELNLQLPDHYNRLGVPQGASKKEIEDAFRLRVWRLKPDARGGVKSLLKITPPKLKEFHFTMLKKAYLTLSDEKKRAAYDGKLARIQKLFGEGIRAGDFRFLALGGARIGRSCYYVKVGGHYVIFDCGLKQGYIVDRFPPFEHLCNFPKPEAVFVSHAHADHIGALPLLLKHIPSNVPVFATADTVRTADKMMRNAVRKAMQEGKELPFGENDIEEALSRIETVEYGRPYKHNGIKFVARNAGHVSGDAMFFVEADGDSVMYTGDFNMERTKTKKPATPFKKRPDLLICEGTYAGRERRGEREEREAKLVSLVRETIKRGGRALIPSFAIGRAGEVIRILDEAVEKGDLPKVKIYAYGLGPALEREWGWKHVEKLESPWEVDRLREETKDVIIVGSGTMDKGWSAQFLLNSAGRKNDSIIIVGHSWGTADLIKRAKKGERVVLDRPTEVKCHVEEVALSAHAAGDKTIKFIQQQRPKNLIIVHSEEPDCIVKNKDLREMRPLSPRAFQIVRKGNRWGIWLKPRPEEVTAGGAWECECGKVFSNFLTAKLHAEKEGHRLKTGMRALLFRYYGVKRFVSPEEVKASVYACLERFTREVASLCAFSKVKAEVPNLYPSEEDLEATMKMISSGKSRKRILAAVEKGKAAVEKGLVKKKDYKDCIERLRQNVKEKVSIAKVYGVSGQKPSIEIRGRVDAGFLKYLKREMEVEYQIRMEKTGEKEFLRVVASPANLPVIAHTEIQGVEKKLGCKMRIPLVYYRALSPGLLGLYDPRSNRILISSELKGNEEHVATVLDHEISHVAQFNLNKHLRGEADGSDEEALLFKEGFAQWLTGKLRNARWLVEVPEKATRHYFEGAKLFEDIETAYGEKEAIKVALSKGPEEFLRKAKSARRKLASGRVGMLKDGFGTLEAAGLWGRYYIFWKGIPPSEREKMVKLVRDRAAEMHEMRYRGWKPEIVAGEASLQIVASEAVMRGGGGDVFRVRKALESVFMEGKYEYTYEKMCEFYIGACENQRAALDGKVLDYIEDHKGKISVSEATHEFRITTRQLKSSIRRLKKAGMLEDK